MEINLLYTLPHMCRSEVNLIVNSYQKQQPLPHCNYVSGHFMTLVVAFLLQNDYFTRIQCNFSSISEKGHRILFALFFPYHNYTFNNVVSVPSLRDVPMLTKIHLALARKEG